MLTNLSLFSGAGGLDLSARLVGGFRTVAYVENDPYAQGVLMSRIRDGSLDDAPIFEDVRTFDGRSLAGSIDVVSGGFPCQPHSCVGKRAGGGDARNYWPNTLQILRECGAPFFLGENVDGILDTYALEVLADLEEAGYCATPCAVSACSIGAPHMRRHVFFLAHAKGIARPETNKTPDKDGSLPRTWLGDIRRGWQEMARIDWTIPSSWVLRDIDGVAYRMDRTRCTGNGVVPQQAAPAWEIIRRMSEV